MKKENNNLNIENLIKTEWFNQFDEYQQEEINLGLEDNLNVFLYAKTEFNEYQMREIRLGLEKNLDVSVYAKSEFDYLQMDQIRFCLEKGLNVSIYATPDFTEKEMRKIKRELIKKSKKKIKNRVHN